MSRKRFSPEVDSIIVAEMQYLEEKRIKSPFSILSRKFPLYTSKQIQQRWCNSLNPKLCHEPLYEEEKSFIVQWVSEKKDLNESIRWRNLTYDLDRRFYRLRSENRIKNYWYSRERRLSRMKKKDNKEEMDDDEDLMDDEEADYDEDLMDDEEADDDEDLVDDEEADDDEDSVDDEEADDNEEMKKDFDNEEEEYSSPMDVANQPHLESILESFSNAGFDPNDITPWVSSLFDEVLEESSDEQIMRRWIEWKSDDADTDMVIGTEGINEGDSDVIYLRKWGLTQEAATRLRQQFSLEAWCEYDLHSRMMWWIEEGINIMPVTNTLYPTQEIPTVDKWIYVGDYNTFAYYVNPEISRETLDDNSATIINELCTINGYLNGVFKLFHATKWQYVQQVLDRIDISFNPRKTDFSPNRAFYTTTEFHTALRHCDYRTDWGGCAAVIIFLLPQIKVKNPERYVYLKENWSEVVVNSRNGIRSNVIEGKWFVQGKQLCNVREVMRVFKNHGKDKERGRNEAKEIATSHNPPRDQLAVIRDEGADILNSAVKGVIILPNTKINN